MIDKSIKNKKMTKILELAIINVTEVSLRGKVEPLVKNKEESWLLEEVSLSIVVYLSCVRGLMK